MTTLIIQSASPPTGPQPASGRHGECLADLERETIKFLQLLACERSGIYDSAGQNFWIGEDAVLAAAQRLVFLAQQRVGAIPQP